MNKTKAMIKPLAHPRHTQNVSYYPNTAKQYCLTLAQTNDRQYLSGFVILILHNK
ncbi:MAG: hypothetical protein AB8W37_05140 [Arsenophonus endosymbiont of Dermacentor nuttalli]